jgi:low affinity Fe/Cu permease
MVFLIQNTQNRDTLALQIKLSELILALKSADDQVADIEDATDEVLEEVHDKIKRKSGKKNVRHT